jgi:uncharacterized membrane protein YciS (DUF1049 family)
LNVRIVATVVLVGLFFTVLIGGLLKFATRARAVTVVRHLRRNGTYKVKIGPFENAWTPESPHSATRLSIGFPQMPGSGTVTYTLDPDSQLVRMRWEGKRGPTYEWSGPLPVTATPGFQRRGRWTLAISLSIFFVSVALGAIAGAATQSFVPGLVAGLIVGYFVAAGFWIERLMRSFRIASAELKTEVPSGEIEIDRSQSQGP